MFRLFLLPAFVIVPVALMPPGADSARPGLLTVSIAAPVPRDAGRPAFGNNGLLTRADLEKVTFNSHVLPDDNSGAAPEPRGGPDGYEVAVHMPWTTFHEGEPIPAYFVLRNNRAETIRLTSWIAFVTPPYSSHGFAFGFTVRDRVTGKPVEASLGIGHTNCGGASISDVPANGFYCQKANLNREAGNPLPPGEYEVEWRYGRVVSAPVAFTVARTGSPSVAAPRYVSFFSLWPGPEGETRPSESGGTFVWRDCRFQFADADSIAGALAVGHHGVYAPDARTIPPSDKFAEASVEWKQYREGDRVAVTLRAVGPHKQLRLEEAPRLFLHVETDTERAGRFVHEEAGEVRQFEDDSYLVTPLTFELQLPKGWRERIATGEARAAVVVVAKPIEFPVSPHTVVWRKEKASWLGIRASNPSVRALPTWNGIVRTAFTELHVPQTVLPVRSR